MSLFKNHLLVGIVYILAALGAIMGEMRGQHALVYACKPLMMLVLSLWFYFKSRRYGDRFTLLIQAGLFFSWLGDMALMLDHIDPYYFLIGLGAFMLAQLCYCIAFAHNVADVGGGQGLLVASLLMAVVLAYGGIFGYEVIPRVDADVQVPAGIYAFVTTLMGAMAALRFGRTYLPSFIMVFAGAVLFIASDSILATARFIRPLDHAPWSVLLLYAAAQYLIARGALRHVLDPEEARRRAALNT
ncbi:MAG: lysoplasmalogenase [Flavobacteriales bacterium]|nr:lysoplasmalogenase [Flavobacteriales bacterium]